MLLNLFFYIYIWREKEREPSFASKSNANVWFKENEIKTEPSMQMNFCFHFCLTYQLEDKTSYIYSIKFKLFIEK